MRKAFRFATFAQCLIVGCALSTAALAQGQEWPQRAITLVVPFPPGGNSDSLARVLSEKISPRLGQPVVVQNRPGATGAIAAAYVAKSAPDGYTLFFAASPQILVLPKIERVNYSVDELTPISAFGVAPMVLGINLKLSASNPKDFLDLIRSNPGKFSYASAGTGSTSHLVAALFLARGGLNMLHVPYKGAGQAAQDLAGGQIEMFFGDVSVMLPYGKGDRIKLIGVSSAHRVSQMPNVPAIAEVLPGFEIRTWNGVFVPARTPIVVIRRLAAEIQAAAADPDVIGKLSAFGIDSVATTPEQFTRMIELERAVYDEAIRVANLKASD